jgi:hypothetical protein
MRLLGRIQLPAGFSVDSRAADGLALPDLAGGNAFAESACPGESGTRALWGLHWLHKLANGLHEPFGWYNRWAAWGRVRSSEICSVRRRWVHLSKQVRQPRFGVSWRGIRKHVLMHMVSFVTDRRALSWSHA